MPRSRRTGMSRAPPRAPSPPPRAPTRSASTSARPAAPPAQPKQQPQQQPQPQQNAPAPQAAGAAPPAQPAPQGRGLMGEIMTTAAGVAAGSVAGRAVDRMIWGSGGGEAAAPAEGQYQPLEVAQQTQQMPQQGEICGFELSNFRQCLEQNNNNVGSCQWNYDILMQCQNPQNSPEQSNY